MLISKVIMLAGLAKSATEATQQIFQNGVSWDAVIVTHPTIDVVPDDRHGRGPWHSFVEGDVVEVVSVPSKWHSAWPTVGARGVVTFGKSTDCSPNAAMVQIGEDTFWMLTKQLQRIMT